MKFVQSLFVKSPASKTVHDGRDASYFKMFSLGILVVLPNILSGMSECYSSIALPDMKLDVESASLFAAIGGYSGLIGIVLIGVIIDSFGRKSSLLLGIVPQVAGWTLLYANGGPFTAILGRALTGLTAVAMFYSAQLYAVECITVNHERLRSNFRAWPGVANSVGTVLTFAGGTFLPYRDVSAFAAVFALLLLALIYALIPESPSWLYLQGRIGDAETSERKLGITQPILRTQIGGGSTGDSGEGGSGGGGGGGDDDQHLHHVHVLRFTWSNLRAEAEKLRRREVYKPVAVMSAMCALIMCTGGVTLTAYMVSVMGADASNLNGSLTTSRRNGVFAGLLILAAHLSVSLVLPYAGNRRMSMATGFFMAVGMVVIGATTGDGNVSDHYMLHVVAVWLVTFSFHFGVLSVPVAVMSDLFPVDAKGFACVAILTLSLCSALVVQSFPFLTMYYGGRVFYGYAVACSAYVIFVYLCMPETVGRTYFAVRNDLL